MRTLRQIALLLQMSIAGARADRAMVESSGAQSPFASNINPSDVGTIESMPGVKHGPVCGAHGRAGGRGLSTERI
ncbi:MAG: hypothetical protein ACREU2_10475 [Steroidobacteraceae bacterium]